MDRLFHNLKYAWMQCGRSSLDDGVPSSMAITRSWSAGSSMVAIWSCSQLIVEESSAEQSAVCRPPSSLCWLVWTSPVSVGDWFGQSLPGPWWSSCRWSRCGVLDPDGCLDRASLARFLVPGTYTILNLYLRERSFRLRSRGFGMSSRQRSPNSFSSGL